MAPESSKLETADCKSAKPSNDERLCTIRISSEVKAKMCPKSKSTANSSPGPPSSAGHHLANNGAQEKNRVINTNRGFNPPCFTIDLSQPPKDRYEKVCVYYKKVLGPGTLCRLLEDVLHQGCQAIWLSTGWACLLRWAARTILRRIHDDEEQAELEGIAQAMSVPMHLLVALNALVDMMMGCSTSGLRTVCGDGEETAMLHLRIMDWHMPRLRRLVVELAFVRRSGSPVVATSLTYFGYVGVFTGVRRGLSMSINFRAQHARTSKRQRMAYRAHQLGVLVGTRRSVSSYLRHCLLTPDAALDGQEPKREAQGSKDIIQQRQVSPINMPILDYIVHPDGFSKTPSTAAYLLFCTPQTVHLLEKDYRQANALSSTIVLTVCNHDRADVKPKAGAIDGTVELVDRGLNGDSRTFLEFSLNRQLTLDALRHQALKVKGRGRGRSGTTNPSQAVNFADVVGMGQHGTICHEQTHYIAVMDPAMGKIVWRRAYN